MDTDSMQASGTQTGGHLAENYFKSLVAGASISTTLDGHAKQLISVITHGILLLPVVLILNSKLHSYLDPVFQGRGGHRKGFTTRVPGIRVS